MNECSSDTVAIPPIVDRSSALNPPDSIFGFDCLTKWEICHGSEKE